MFNKKIVITLVVFITIIIGFGTLILNEATNGKSTTTVLPVIATKLVKIEGMTCEACEQALAGAAKKIKGVESITASAKNGNA
ncbi:MAG: heavy metal-associated domain-containing protein, partial [Sulfurimonas sp.]|nr:heavy metal-associated domain-containing protein [Sulfurimonas sp.]